MILFIQFFKKVKVMIYFDNASTTMPDKTEVNHFIDATKNFFNPSAAYNVAVEVNKNINNIRRATLQSLNASTLDNFVFTSGATEANNLIIKGVTKKKSAKLIFSAGEHPSVYNVAKELAGQGYNVVFIPLLNNGKVNDAIFAKEMDENTAFVSMIHVSNETGAINDIQKLVAIAKSKNPNVVFHSDGVQAFGKINVNLSHLQVDAYTISAHKCNGLKGIGGLYLKNGVNIKPQILGGGQEKTLRSGTENYPAIFSFNQTINVATDNIEKKYNHVKELSTFLKQEINNNFFDIKIASDDNCSPYIVSLMVGDVMSETLVYMLSEKSCYVGNGSACSSKNKNNRILESMGYGIEDIKGAIRVSFSANNNIDEIKLFLHALKSCIDEYKSKVLLKYH